MIVQDLGTEPEGVHGRMIRVIRNALVPDHMRGEGLVPDLEIDAVHGIREKGDLGRGLKIIVGTRGGLDLGLAITGGLAPNLRTIVVRGRDLVRGLLSRM